MLPHQSILIIKAHQWLVETIIKYFDKWHSTPTLDTLHIEVKKIDNDVLKTSVVEQLKEAYKASNEDARVCRSKNLVISVKINN